MRNLFRTGVAGLIGVLVLGGCGGTPMYERRAVPSAPSTPTPAAPSSPPSASPSSTSSGQDRPSRTSTPSPTSSVARSGPAPSSTTPSSTTPPRGNPTTLDTMGGPGSGPILIGGKRYSNSFAVSACTIFSTQPTYTFDLASRYRRLTGVVGQDDASASRDAVLKLTIRGDGRSLATRTVRYGQSTPIRVELSGVDRLTLSFTEVSCGSDGAALAFGAARVE